MQCEPPVWHICTSLAWKLLLSGSKSCPLPWEPTAQEEGESVQAVVEDAGSPMGLQLQKAMELCTSKGSLQSLYFSFCLLCLRIQEQGDIWLNEKVAHSNWIKGNDTLQNKAVNFLPQDVIEAKNSWDSEQDWTCIQIRTASYPSD